VRLEGVKKFKKCFSPKDFQSLEMQTTLVERPGFAKNCTESKQICPAIKHQQNFARFLAVVESDLPALSLKGKYEKMVFSRKFERDL